jgi:hypothetical protein
MPEEAEQVPAPLFTEIIAERVHACLEQCRKDYPAECLGGVVAILYNPQLGDPKPDAVVVGDVTAPGIPVLLLRTLVEAVDYVHELHTQQVNAGMQFIQHMQEEISDRQSQSGQTGASGAVPENDSGADRGAGDGDAG